MELSELVPSLLSPSDVQKIMAPVFDLWCPLRQSATLMPLSAFSHPLVDFLYELCQLHTLQIPDTSFYAAAHHFSSPFAASPLFAAVPAAAFRPFPRFALFALFALSTHEG
jgi:hypothetical protein